MPQPHLTARVRFQNVGLLLLCFEHLHESLHVIGQIECLRMKLKIYWRYFLHVGDVIRKLLLATNLQHAAEVVDLLGLGEA